MDKEEIVNAKLNRRGFLWLMAGGVVTAAATAFGCGGGSGGGGGGSIPIGTISEDDRHNLLDAIQDFLSNNVNLPLDEQATAALNFVRARPEFIDSDIDEDGVWAIFVDAVPLMLFFNREANADPMDRPGQGRAPTEVPDHSTAMLINTLGPYYVDETILIKPLLQGNGYSTIVDPGTVESLRAFNDDGVFYFSAHSGVIGVPLLNAAGNFIPNPNRRGIMGRREFGITTSTRADRATVSSYIDDIAHGRLGIGIARYGTGQPGSPLFERNYCITAAFVDTYMNFGQDSLVWFSSCNSNNARSQAFVQACLNAGAGLYVGWNRRADESECIAVGKFVLDRLLGANATTPLENPLQRPFDYVQVWQDMARQGLPSGLIYTVGSGNFGLLAPTIAYVFINEFDEEAHLFGLFGNVASNEREVLIGGTPAMVKSWAIDKIVCELPQSGPGSSGDVEVRVRGHKSNVRQITEWRFQVTYDWKHTELNPLSTAGIFNLTFRADVGHYRDRPGVPPLEPIRWAIATKDSQANLGASGTNSDGDCDNTWSGTAQYEAGGFGGLPDHTIVARMKIDTDTMTGALGMSLGDLAGPPFTWTIACPGAPPVNEDFTVSVGLLGGTHNFLTPDPNRPATPLPALDLTFGTDFKVPSVHFIDDTFSPIKIDITWLAVTPTSPPDPNAARSVPDRRGG